MALLKKKTSEEASCDLVMLTETEALKYQLETISVWAPQSDVWPFRSAMGILAGIGALSGIYINKHYRTKLHLGSMARISTYIPIVALPGIMSALFHHQFVLLDVVIQKTPCPVCVQMRAVALQVATGVLYPMVLAPLATFTFAARLNTYNVPYLSSAEGRRQALQLWRKITHPIVTPVLLMVGLQAIAATFITYSEQKSIATVNAKLRSAEQKYEETKHS